MTSYILQIIIDFGWFFNKFSCKYFFFFSVEESWQNIHKKESHPCSSVDLPCLVRQKLYRTTSMYDSCKPFDFRGSRKKYKGRPVVSAGGRPRTGPGMLSVSLPEHTLRAALENVSKAHGNSEEDGDSENEEEASGKNNKELKNGNSPGSARQNVMKIEEMFERAKVLLPSVRCECACVGEQEQADEEVDLAVDNFAADRAISATENKKEWTIFSFCYECGRTSGVHLVKCPGCRSVSYCSRTCRSDSWKRGHQKECTGAQVKRKDTDSSPAKGKSATSQRTKITKRANSNNAWILLLS